MGAAWREVRDGSEFDSVLEMVRGVKDLSSYEGIFAAPEGGALVGALRKMLNDGTVSKDERVLLLVTGSGLKYLDVLTPALAALA